MSCNYAEGLSPYEHKGILGVPEKFEPIDKFNKKCDLLAQLLNQSKHVVIHTGAGISTSAGIPDFRGPNGVWTLEKKGKKPSINVSFADAKPTKTHLILKKLIECKKVHYIVSQNIDGLHLKSGLARKYLSELHGNMFVDESPPPPHCKNMNTYILHKPNYHHHYTTLKRFDLNQSSSSEQQQFTTLPDAIQFVRSAPVETVGKKCSGVPCAADHVRGRPCRGRLFDGVLDWEHSLPENDLLMAEWHSSQASQSICLLITSYPNMRWNPLQNNLDVDNKADLIINYYVDEVLERVMNILGIQVPDYSENDNPMKLAACSIVDWTIARKDVLALEKIFKAKCKGVKKKRILIKKRNSDVNGISGDSNIDDKTKIIKLEAKDVPSDSVTENGIEQIKVENDADEQNISNHVVK
ncbi:hypothetical protein MSG28_012238 [Choristoneura fumiferana]|uniref:Uncharacterized protein n=1 Tax=Choristoneura fumiferana TaxID=7141 RepID=A0ACC0KCR8_CHOFU|nr:hypothetical protein MSG28_012238 [Choristoneura fumiferana]